MGFTPAVSKSAQKSMRAKTKAQRFYRRTDLDLSDIAKMFNPVLKGWINYYGKYHRAELSSVLRHFNKTLVAWAMRKFKKLKGSKINAAKLLANMAKSGPKLFVHWQLEMVGAFA